MSGGVVADRVAGATHRARPGRRYPSATNQLLLRDGSRVVVRPIRSTDRSLLADGFARLSAQSRRMRFLTAKEDLSPSELTYLTDVDQVNHVALGALSLSDGRGVGIARYVRNTGATDAAEIAVTVVDEWQRRGLGSHLLTRLARSAWSNGIRRFTALTTADNVAVFGVLRVLRAELSHVRFEFDTLEFDIALNPAI